MNRRLCIEYNKSSCYLPLERCYLSLNYNAQTTKKEVQKLKNHE